MVHTRSLALEEVKLPIRGVTGKILKGKFRQAGRLAKRKVQRFLVSGRYAEASRSGKRRMGSAASRGRRDAAAIAIENRYMRRRKQGVVLGAVGYTGAVGTAGYAIGRRRGKKANSSVPKKKR